MAPKNRNSATWEVMAATSTSSRVELSGGTADLPERWPALNHAIAVNKLLGFDHRVALAAREGHTPTPEANEQVYRFFEWCLRPPAGLTPAIPPWSGTPPAR